MDAIALLKQQHREVERLFEQAAVAQRPEKELIFCQIAGTLALHTTLEERIFYPSVLAEQTEEKLQEALQEHLQMKRLLADLLDFEASDERFDAKLSVLQEEVRLHVEREEGAMFTEVRRLFPKEALEALGSEMEVTAEDLESEDLVERIPSETYEAPALQL